MIILKTILISSYFLTYRKIPKISPRAYIFQRLIFGGAYFWRGLCTEGNLRFIIDWASLYWEGNLPFLLRFTLYSRANSMYKPPRVLYSEGRFNGGFFALRFWGAYVWRGLFSEFYGNSVQQTQVLLDARKYVPFALLNYLSYFSTNNDSLTFQARKMKFYKFHYMTLPSP